MEWLLEYVPEAPEQDFRDKKRRGESGSPTKWAVADDLEDDARRLKVSNMNRTGSRGDSDDRFQAASVATGWSAQYAASYSAGGR